MIETVKQAKDALAEIQGTTEWSEYKMAKKIGIHRATVMRIVNGTSKTTSDATMDKIDKELKRVRKLHG